MSIADTGAKSDKTIAEAQKTTEAELVEARRAAILDALEAVDQASQRSSREAVLALAAKKDVDPETLARLTTLEDWAVELRKELAGLKKPE